MAVGVTGNLHERISWFVCSNEKRVAASGRNAIPAVRDYPTAPNAPCERFCAPRSGANTIITRQVALQQVNGHKSSVSATGRQAVASSYLSIATPSAPSLPSPHPVVYTGKGKTRIKLLGVEKLPGTCLPNADDLTSQAVFECLQSWKVHYDRCRVLLTPDLHYSSSGLPCKFFSSVGNITGELVANVGFFGLQRTQATCSRAHLPPI